MIPNLTIAAVMLTLILPTAFEWTPADVADTANYYDDNKDEWSQFVSLVKDKPKILDDAYDETASDSIVIGGESISLRQFTYTGEFWPPSPYPKYMIELCKGSKKVCYPLYSPRIIDKQWRVYHKPKPLLVLERWTGGNSDNALHHLLISLDSDNLFHFIGYVDTAEEVNGEFALIRRDAHFGYCMALGTHPGSPTIEVPCKIQGLKIAPDKEKLTIEMNKSISKIDEEFSKLEKSSLHEDGSYIMSEEFLSDSLRKFKYLVYLEKYDDAWALIQDLLEPIGQNELVKIKPGGIGITLPDFMRNLEEAYPQAIRH